LRRLPLLAFALLLTLTPSLSRAQAEPPPVLDPGDIFTDAVEVVETLPIEQTISAIEPDNESRILYYFDSTTSETAEYPYPDELEEIGDWKKWADDTYLLINGYARFPMMNIQDAWVFDPDERNFSHPDSSCGVVKALPNEGVWIIYQMPDTESYYLCFTETGELSEPLPADIQGSLCTNTYALDRPPRITPGGNWVVFTDCNAPYTVYAYNVETQQLNSLGIANRGSWNFEVVRWINEHMPIIEGDILGTQQYRYVYTADVSMPDSLELVASQYISWPQYYDELPGYVWVGEDFKVYEHNLETRETRVILSKGCYNRVASCIAVPSAMEEPIAYIAILEQVVQVSPGFLTIYDVESGDAVFRLAFSAGFGFREDQCPLEWVNDHIFLLGNTNNSTGWGHLVSLDNGVITERVFNPLYSRDGLSPDKQYLLIWSTEPNTSQGISLFEINSERTIPIVQPLNPELYRVGVSWKDNELLQVTITDNQGSEHATLGRWLIRIP
jgi:hypothetical protein